MSTTATDTVNKLNGLLKGELSACETYRQALEKVTDSRIKDQLKECHMCHSARVDTIVEKINELGGKAADSSGAWGTFAKFMEGGATVFGDKASIAILEEGEDKGLSDYRKLIEDGDPQVKAVASALLSKQEGTHQKMSELKHSLS